MDNPKKGDQVESETNLNKGDTYILDIAGWPTSVATLIATPGENQDGFVFVDVDDHDLHRIYPHGRSDKGTVIFMRHGYDDVYRVRIYEVAAEKNMLKGGKRKRTRRRKPIRRHRRSRKSTASK